MCAVRVPEIFRVFNAAIAHAHSAGDDLTVNLLLVAKLAAVRYHYSLVPGVGE
jgi:hypothetical protein